MCIVDLSKGPIYELHVDYIQKNWQQIDIVICRY